MPGAAGGVALVVHGSLVVATASEHLQQQPLQMTRRDSGSGAGNYKTLSNNQINKVKRAGLDPEELKKDLIGQDLADKYNIAVDSEKNIVFVPVRPGGGPSIETGISILDFVPDF